MLKGRKVLCMKTTRKPISNNSVSQHQNIFLKMSYQRGRLMGGKEMKDIGRRKWMQED